MTAVDAAAIVAAIGEDDLREFVLGRRWFASKAREVAHLSLLEAPVVQAPPPLMLALALVEVRFHPGTHELYQLPLGLRPAEEGWDEAVVATVDGWTVYDALEDPSLARELGRLMHGQQTLTTEDGRLEFRTVEGADPVADSADVRRMGVEQSNTSVVFDERLVLKLYRRLEPGVNPELELVRFLTERGFAGTPALADWAAYVGQPLDATLAILQQFVPGEGDGWALALASLGAGREEFVPRLRRLGELTGQMHTVLGSDNQDAAFCPEEPSGEALAILTATIDEEIERVFVDLPEDSDFAPLAGRGEEVREVLRQRSQAGRFGKQIRHHGDYHLGQVLWTGEDWVILDFEGEPARPISERRRKRSPLRDVAGMLRSFAYAASSYAIEHGGEADVEWERQARDEFLAGYHDEIDPALVPAGDGFDNLLAIFELEKAVYELRYELNNRPDWVRIPIAGIVRLLEEGSA